MLCFSRQILPSLLVVAVFALGGCSSAEQRAQSYYKHGVELDSNGEPIKAGLEFRNALKLKGDFVLALIGLGKVEEEQGHYDTAFQAYSSVAEQAADNVESRVRMAYILLGAGQVDDASKYADQAYAIDATNASALVAKAAIELKLNNAGNAVHLAESALTQDPASTDALAVLASERLKASDPAGALTFLDKATGKTAGDVGLQFLRLTALDALGDQPGVEKLFTKLIQLYPDNAGFRESMVRWYMSKGRKVDAERVARQFATDNPKDDSAQLFLVALVNSENGPAAAIAELKRLISVHSEAGNDVFRLQMGLAQLQFSTGDSSSAITLMTSVVASSSVALERNQARVELAKMDVETKDLVQAENLVNAVLSEDSKNVDALGLRASIRLQNGKTADAIDDLLVAANEAPNSAGISSQLAEAYERNGATALAEEQYAKAMALDQNSPETGLPMVRFLLRYGRAEQARHVLDAVRLRAPDNRQVLTLLAQLQLASGDWVGAQQVADALRALTDSDSKLAADKIGAAALSGLNRGADSVNLLEKALAGASDRTAVASDLVRAYVQAGKQPAAEGYLKSLIESDPQDVQARVLLGAVYQSMSNKQAAELAFKDAVSVDKGVVGTTALAQFYLSEGKFDAATSAARLGLQRDNSSAALHLLLATVYENTQQFDAAIAEYQTMFSQDPESTVAANGLASLLSERRGTPEALDQAFEIAQRFRNAEIPQYADTLGWIYYLRNDYQSALPFVRDAADKLPKTALVQFHLAMTLAKLNRTDDAMAALKNVISLSPPLFPSDLEKAKQELAQLQQPAAATANAH